MKRRDEIEQREEERGMVWKGWVASCFVVSGRAPLTIA